MSKNMIGVLGAGVVAALLSASPAHAVLIDAKGTGVNYALSESVVDSNTSQFTLTITGINDTTANSTPGDVVDSEGGRSGVNAIAFNRPPGFTNATMITPPAGYVLVLGGLNSSGCDGSGNFFCFDNTAIPPTPSSPLPDDSSLTFIFNVDTSGNFPVSTYNPSFKIDWVGSQNNYDLISLPIGVTGPGTPTQQCTDPNGCGVEVPEPASLALMGSGLIALGGVLWWRRRRDEDDGNALAS